MIKSGILSSATPPNLHRVSQEQGKEQDSSLKNLLHLHRTSSQVILGGQYKIHIDKIYNSL